MQPIDALPGQPGQPGQPGEPDHSAPSGCAGANLPAPPERSADPVYQALDDALPVPVDTREHLRVLLMFASDRDAAKSLMALREGGFRARHERIADLQQLDEALGRHDWDIVLAETGAGQWTPRDVLDRVASRSPGLAVIFVCGPIGEDAAVGLLRAGAADCIHRSSLASRLAPAIRGVLDGDVRDAAGPPAASDRPSGATAAAAQPALQALRALDALAHGMAVTDAQRRIAWVNSGVEAMTGHARADLLGQPMTLLAGPGSSPRTMQAIQTALDAGRGWTGEILHYRKDGSSFWDEMSIEPVRGDDGRLTHFAATLRNVDERRVQQHHARLAAQVFAQSREGITVTDAGNRIVMVNKAFGTMTGYSAQEVLGHDPQELQSTDQDAGELQAQWTTIAELGRWEGETVGRRKDGSEYPQWLTVTAIHDEEGEICNYVRTSSDLSTQHAARERIAWLSHFDALTRLPNRSLLAERCASLIQRAATGQTPLVLMVLGVDRFKSVNDSLGHEVGDELLYEIARRISGFVGEHDTVARVGGDEFVLVVPGEIAHGAADMARRLAERLARTIEVHEHEVSIGVSIGIAVYPADGSTFDALFKAGQSAMRHAKELGGGQHRFFNKQQFEDSLEQAALGKVLRNAIALEQLHLQYQPFVDLQTGRIAGMEALLRWTHPELGKVSPVRFIPVAERSGLIVEIGDWVLARTCEDIRRWTGQGLVVPQVSVNLSPLQFRDPGLVGKVQATLAQFGIDPSRITLELTEGAVIDDVPHSEAQLRALKSLGVQLSLDDFGTGYSSLSYLKLFPFDKVKIDKSFVRDISTNSQDAVIARVVISMAHGLGMQVVAEGVETELQCAFMRQNACDVIQGYFFSRPVDAPDMVAMLQEDRRLPAHLVRGQSTSRCLLLVDHEADARERFEMLVRPDGYRILGADRGRNALEIMAREPVDVIVVKQNLPDMSGVDFLRQAKTLRTESFRILLALRSDTDVAAQAVNDGTVDRFLTRPWNGPLLRSFITQAFSHQTLEHELEQVKHQLRGAKRELAAQHRTAQTTEWQRQNEPHDRQPVLQADVLRVFAAPVITLDGNGIVTFANTSAEQLFDAAGPLPGNDIADVSPELGALLEQTPPGDLAHASVAGRSCGLRWHVLDGGDSTSGPRIVTLSMEDML